MATFYLDFEGGNDANAGTSFATRWKTITNGATAARTAPGDTIRVMGSPAPTSLGINGTWTSSSLAGTKTITAATNASPISVTAVGHGYSTGDTVAISAAVGNTAANGVWEITVTGADTFTLNGSTGNGTYTSGGSARLINNRVVRLASALTANIASTGPRTAAWTASANVTTTLSTTTKEHYQADSIAVGAAFTTGLAAYYPTGTLDLSGYQQVSFWIYQNSGNIGALGSIDLRLCSDAAGTTAVNTITIPVIGAGSTWHNFTVDLGTNLGNSIQSIAFYVNTDNGAQTFLLSNIIACKASSAADSLSLTSLIGKNTSGETFWGIQSINGTRVLLDASNSIGSTSATARGYYGTSETVTTYKRETIKLGPSASSTTAVQTVNEGGTEGLPIIYSGGWNRTDMSTQTLETWLDGVNGNGYGVTGNQSFITFEKFALVRFSNSFVVSTTSTNQGLTLSFSALNNNSNSGINGVFKNSSITVDHGVGNSIAAVDTTTAINGGSNTFTLTNMTSNGSYGVSMGYHLPSDKFTFNVKNNGSYGAGINNTNGGHLVVNSTSIGNFSGGFTSAGSGPVYLKNTLINDSNEFILSSSYENIIYSQDHDQTPGNHKIFMTGGLISAATDQRYNPSGISWKMQPTSSTRSNVRPMVLSLAKIACAANSLVTVKAWMRRDNAGLTMRLVCKGGQIAGVTNDVTSTLSTTNAWEEETITFTPTETGIVEITAEAYGGTLYSGWVDSMTISQA